MDKVLGNYRGEVVEVEDRDGRVRVNVFGVYDDIPTDVLPWALYADSFMGGGPNRGGRFIPDVGDHVWVFFEGGDINQPVYWAGAPAKGDGPTEASTSNRVIRTKGGHSIELDDTEGAETIRVTHKAGTVQETTADGSVNETVVGDQSRSVSGEDSTSVSGSQSTSVSGSQTASISGSVSISSGGSTSFSAPGITMDAPTTNFSGMAAIAGAASIGTIATIGTDALVGGISFINNIVPDIQALQSAVGLAQLDISSLQDLVSDPVTGLLSRVSGIEGDFDILNGHIDDFVASTGAANFADALATLASRSELDAAKDELQTSINEVETIANNVPIMETPPLVQDFRAQGTVNAVLLLWRDPTLVYRNHGYTEIWRSTQNELSTAEKIKEVTGAFYNDQTGPGYSGYWWARNVSNTGTVGPFNSTDGSVADASLDVPYMLANLTGEIRESQLFKDLASRIDLIDGPPDMIMSVANRIQEEAQARLAALDVLTQELQNEADVRITEVTNLRSDLQAEAEERVGDVLTLTTDLQTEVDTRIAEVEALRVDLQAQIDDVGAVFDDIGSIPVFDSTLSYSDGDLVKYEDRLYQAIQNMAAPSPLPTDTLYWEDIGAYVTLDDALTAHALLLSKQSTKVVEIDGVLTSQGEEINVLQSAVNDPVTGLDTKASIGELNTTEASIYGAEVTAFTNIDTRFTNQQTDIDTRATKTELTQAKSDIYGSEVTDFTQINATFVDLEGSSSQNLLPADAGDVKVVATTGTIVVAKTALGIISPGETISISQDILPDVDGDTFETTIEFFDVSDVSTGIFSGGTVTGAAYARSKLEMVVVPAGSTQYQISANDVTAANGASSRRRMLNRGPVALAYIEPTASLTDVQTRATKTELTDAKADIFGAEVFEFTNIDTRFTSQQADIDTRATSTELTNAKSEIYGAEVTAFTNIDAQFTSQQADIDTRATKTELATAKSDIYGAEVTAFTNIDASFSDLEGSASRNLLPSDAATVKTVAATGSVMTAREPLGGDVGQGDLISISQDILPDVDGDTFHTRIDFYDATNTFISSATGGQVTGAAYTTSKLASIIVPIGATQYQLWVDDVVAGSGASSRRRMMNRGPVALAFEEPTGTLANVETRATKTELTDAKADIYGSEVTDFTQIDARFTSANDSGHENLLGTDAAPEQGWTGSYSYLIQETLTSLGWEVGEVKSFSVDARTSGGSSQVRAVLEFLDGANAVLSSSTVLGTAGTTAYEELKLENIAIPASTASVNVRVEDAVSDGTTYYTRRAMLNNGPLSVAFVDASATLTELATAKSDIYGSAVTQFTFIDAKFTDQQADIDTRATSTELTNAKSEIYGAEVTAFTNIDAQFTSQQADIDTRATKTELGTAKADIFGAEVTAFTNIDASFSDLEGSSSENHLPSDAGTVKTVAATGTIVVAKQSLGDIGQAELISISQDILPDVDGDTFETTIQFFDASDVSTGIFAGGTVTGAAYTRSKLESVIVPLGSTQYQISANDVTAANGASSRRRMLNRGAVAMAYVEPTGSLATVESSATKTELTNAKTEIYGAEVVDFVNISARFDSTDTAISSKAEVTYVDTAVANEESARISQGETLEASISAANDSSTENLLGSGAVTEQMWTGSYDYLTAIPITDFGWEVGEAKSFSVQAKTSGGSSQARVQILFLDGTGTILGGGSTLGTVGITIYERVKVENAIIPSGTASVTIRVADEVADGTVYYSRRAMLNNGPTAMAFVDASATLTELNEAKADIYGSAVTQFTQIDTKFTDQQTDINTRATKTELSNTESTIYDASVTTFTNINARFTTTDDAIGQNEADITSAEQAIADETSARTTQYNALEVTLGNNFQGGGALNPAWASENLDLWTVRTAAKWTVVLDPASPLQGAHYLRLQDNDSVSDNVFEVETTRIDPNKNYMVDVWVRQPAGGGAVYLTVDFRDSADVSIQGSTSDAAGWPSKGTYHYYGIVNQVPPSVWTRYQISFGPDTDTDPDPTITSPVTAPSNAVGLRLGALAGRGPTVATDFHIGSYRVRELDNALELPGISAKAGITYVDEAEVRARDDAIASATQQVYTTLDPENGEAATSASVETKASSWDGTTAQWTVKTDVAGLVAGAGLYNDGVTTRFLVQADQFAVYGSSFPDASPDDAMPFIVSGGITYVKQLAVQKGDIFNLTVGDVIQSGNYVAGSDGWQIDKLGNAEFSNGIFRGTITVTNETDVRTQLNVENGAEKNTAGTIALLLNKTVGGSLSDGEGAILGTRDGVPDPLVDGYIYWNGAKITVERNQVSSNLTIVTGAPGPQNGFILFDTAKTNPFTYDNAVSGDIAFVRKLASGQWQYDTNTSWGNFTPTASMVALGWLRSGSTDIIESGGLFGQPVSYDLASFPAATDNGRTLDENGNAIGTIVTTGTIYSGKSTYGSSDAGWLFEYNGGTPRFEVGDASNYLRWTGTSVEIAGSVSITSGQANTRADLNVADGADVTAPRFLYANTLLNGSFELDLEGWPLGTATVSTATAYRGTKSLRCDADAGTIQRLTDIQPIDAGERVLVWGRARAYTSPAPDGSGRITVLWYDSSDSYISSSATDLAPKVFSADTSYIAQRAVVTAPANAAGFRIRCRHHGTTGSYAFDNIGYAVLPQNTDIDLLNANNAVAQAGADVTGLNKSESILVPDTRNDNELPSFYRAKGVGLYAEFKDRVALGWPGTGRYVFLSTEVKWQNTSGGRVTQTFIDDEGVKFKRKGATDDSSWNAWVEELSQENYNDKEITNVLEDTDIISIARPVGGIKSIRAVGVPGAIKITLPQFYTSTMMQFTVDVFQYEAGKAFTMTIAGYTNPNGWTRQSARIMGDISSNNTVRFGNDGSKACIWIGHYTDSWNYPKVVVRDFLAGHSNYGRNQWDTGWNISFATAFDTIDQTIADSLIDANAIPGTKDGTTGSVDGTLTVGFVTIDGNTGRIVVRDA